MYVSVRLCTVCIEKTYIGKTVVVANKTETISMLAEKENILTIFYVLFFPILFTFF